MWNSKIQARYTFPHTPLKNSPTCDINLRKNANLCQWEPKVFVIEFTKTTSREKY